MTSVHGRPTLRGACDIASAPAIEAWLASFRDVPIEVDLRGVTFFDSAALLVFLRAVRHNPNLRVVEPSEVVVRVLEATDTTEYLVRGRDIFE